MHAYACWLQAGGASVVHQHSGLLHPQDPAAGEPFGTIRGAVRFGDGAAIGDGYYMSAHGGSIETALDEATAELVRTAGGRTGCMTWHTI